jgi:PAS domain S-box-containing protein
MDRQIIKAFSDRRQDALQAWLSEFSEKGAGPGNRLKETLKLGFNACSEAIMEENLEMLDPFIDLLLKQVTHQERGLPQTLRLLEDLRRAITRMIRKEADGRSAIEAMGQQDRCIAYVIEKIANHFNQLYLQACRDISARDEQIEKLKGREFKFTSKKARGWVDVGGTRMCLLDISGGWVNVGLSIMLFAGEGTSRRVLFEAGQSETFSGTALEKGILEKTAQGFCDAVDTYSEAGFGDFLVKDLAFEKGYVRIVCRNTFEGWALLHNNRHSETPVCHYSTGVLLSFMKNMTGRDDLISVETMCIARGDEECEFMIGTEVELKKKGIVPPEWGMTIREKVEYLENLLHEKNRVEREIKKKNVELSALNLISAAVNQSLNLNEILNLAINELYNIVGDKGICIYLLDRNKEELVLTAQRGFSADFIKSVGRLKIWEGMSGDVAQQRAPMACDDYSKYPRALESALKEEKIKSLLSVPLMAKDQIVGVLNVATRTPYHFAAEEISRMTLIGNQIGVAIENAQLHEEIKESERKYKTLVEDINDGYFMCQDGQVIFTNNAFLAMHGYNRDEVLGRDFREFLSKEYMPHVERLFRNGITGDKIPEHIEFRRKHLNGTRLPTELKINIVEFKGRPALVGIFRDISARKEMERKVKESEWLASIGQLSANIAHEIRNPLSAIKTNIQILLRNLDLQGFNKRRLEIAAEEIRRLDRILEDTLDFAAPLKMDKDPHDIHEVVEKCMDLLGDRIRDGKIRVVRKMSSRLGSIPMNGEKILQTILNIILNAIDAMSNGGTLEIATGETEHLGQKMLRIEIKDAGQGISPEDMNRIFNPFFSTKTKGAGLGLSNVKKIIEAHKGIVEVDSRLGIGTLVRVLLPVE